MFIVAHHVFLLVCIKAIVRLWVDLAIWRPTRQVIVCSIFYPFVDIEEVNDLVFHDLALLTLPQVWCKNADCLFACHGELYWVGPESIAYFIGFKGWGSLCGIWACHPAGELCRAVRIFIITRAYKRTWRWLQVWRVVLMVAWAKLAIIQVLIAELNLLCVHLVLHGVELLSERKFWVGHDVSSAAMLESRRYNDARAGSFLWLLPGCWLRSPDRISLQVDVGWFNTLVVFLSVSPASRLPPRKLRIDPRRLRLITLSLNRVMVPCCNARSIILIVATGWVQLLLDLLWLFPIRSRWRRRFHWVQASFWVYFTVGSGNLVRFLLLLLWLDQASCLRLTCLVLVVASTGTCVAASPVWLAYLQRGRPKRMIPILPLSRWFLTWSRWSRRLYQRL